MGWLLALARSVFRYPPPPPEPEPPAGDVAAQLLALHNRARVAAYLPPLRADARLEAAAMAHVLRMSAVDVLAHSGIGDGNLWLRAATQGYTFSAVAENIAMNTGSPAAVVAAWLASAAHRLNVLGAFEDFGAARCAGPKGRVYWCAVFGLEERA